MQKLMKLLCTHSFFFARDYTAMAWLNRHVLPTLGGCVLFREGRYIWQPYRAQ